MTGLELAEGLRAVKPDLKVIISSGYSAEIVHTGAPSEPGIAYLPKPFSVATLATILRESLDRMP
jgi:CheY-like chemotaxis protein